MIETEVFQKNFVGRDGFIWWIGQIASDSWTRNSPGSSASGIELQKQKGFDYRYQVRIMGYHTADKDELPDDQLPWATVVYPVTAGGGVRGFLASPNLKQGNFVYGFFMDGDDAQQPVILGILGFNQYQEVLKGVSPVGFAPFSGFSNPLLNTAPTFSLSKATQDKLGIFGGEASKSREVTGAAGDATTQSVANNKEKRDGEKEKELDSNCDESATGVQKAIRELIKDIEDAKESLNEVNDSLTVFQEDVEETQKWIQKKIKKTAKKIVKWIKKKIKAIFKWITNKIKKATDPVLATQPPDKKTDAKTGIEKALELLKCAFDKIIDHLLDIVIRGLKEALLRWVNVPLCAAENILAAILGKLMGLINAIVNSISGVINNVMGLVDDAIDIADDLIGFLDALLSIFELCDEEKPACPRITDWSIWDGSSTLDNPFDMAGFIDKVKGFASGVSDVVDPDNFDFDFDFSDVFDTSMCDTGPELCGPPQVIIWGGSGSGAAGNAIVSAIGNIIGVEVTNAGTGYAEDPPYIRFADNCGNGNGATGTAVTGPVSPTDLKPYRAKRQNINKKPPTSLDDWERLTIPTEGLPLWHPSVTYYGERRISTPEIEYLPSEENANLKKLYESPVEVKDAEGNVVLKTAAENGYQASMSVGVATFSDTIIPADVVAYSPNWVADDNGDYVGVTGVTIRDTGYGYLPVFDGSQGGDGRIWAPANNSTLESSDGIWSPPYSPGSLIPVLKGDTVCTPVGSVTELNGVDGKVTELLGGCNVMPTDGVVAAPEGTGVSRESENVYPVVLYICEATIINPGFGYQEGDKVIIQPDNGAEITPKFGNFGNLISLEVISGGEGFQDMPIAYIESESGINAEISLRLCIDRIGDDAAKEPGVQDKVVSVVDCVGKI